MDAVHPRAGEPGRQRGDSAAHAPVKYRADIDGLRGFAVLAVVWFHSGLPGIAGGFAGVDIFYVISGYLITLIIHREVARNEFSFANFYERRVRRIAPALLLVTAAATLAGYALLLPYELDQFGQSAVAAVGMVSNIFFWRTGGYFALTETTVPLLHSWSLGVEEQFYLLFPATLLLAERLRLTKAAIVSIAAGSFLLCLIATDKWASAAFYLLPARGWELMIGAAIAVGVVTVPERLKGAAGVTGLVLMIAATVMLSESDPFPGWRAAVPTLGAALVIGSGTRTIASRVLAFRPLVYVGKVSYSFYLWHWPIFVFLRHFRADLDLPPLVSVLGISAAFLLSALSYHWIEQPARRRTVPFRRVVVPSIASGSAIVIASAAAIVTNGVPGRLPPHVVAISRGHDAYAPLAHSCTDIGFEQALKHCHLGPPGPPEFLLWGDSHAAAISEAVTEALKRPGLVVSWGGCPPTVGWVSPSFRGADRDICLSTNRKALRLAETEPNIGTVVLSAYWIAPDREGGTAFWQSVQAAADRLLARGKRVVVIAGVPDPGVDVPWASAIRMRFSRAPLKLTCSAADIPLKRVTIVDVSADFCGRPAYALFSDSNHPSRYAGLAIIAPAIENALAADGRFSVRSGANGE